MMLDHELQRAGELKQELVQFATDRFHHRLSQVLETAAGDQVDEARLVALMDRFVLQHRLDDGTTVVERFVHDHLELSDWDRATVLAWQDPVEQPFKVVARRGEAVVAVGLVDDLTYSIRSTVGPSALRSMRRRSFIFARIVPVGDEWILSGTAAVLPRSDRDRAYRIAFDLSLRAPELAFRNPEKLRQARELDAKNRKLFIRFFGDDMTVMPGSELSNRLTEFWQYHRRQVCTENEADRPSPLFGPWSPEDLPDDLVDSSSVAVIYDEVDGLGFYAEFAEVAGAFADPRLAESGRHRDLVLGYLHDDSVEPSVLRRLADRDPDKASVLFGQLLERPGFNWEADGEALLRASKPDYFRNPPMPAVCPLGSELAQWARERRATPA